MTVPLTPDERRKAIIWIDKRKRFYRFAYFAPYPKQREFLDMGGRCHERLFMAGNRNGKTETGAFEAVCHATGLYPPWWVGARFTTPTKGWACGETSLMTRDVCQTKLCGDPGVDAAFGTGMIPKHLFADKPSLARGITDAFDTLQVKHVSGGISIIRFKSYEQGRSKFQGEGLHWLWCDEEPPMELYSEGLARLGEHSGIAWTTFTPLQGRSDVVIRFLDEPSDDRGLVTMTIDDAEHIPAAERTRIIALYPPHQREARARGVPMLGSGRIFTATEESITEPPLEYIPPHWVKLWGIDPGIGHPFGAALILWDRDNDVVHVHHAFRMADALPLAHAFRMKQIGAGVPVAYPKDAGDREKGTGEPLAAQYKKHELMMLHEHATWPDGSVSTEAGIMEMDERMKTGRFKVAAHLSEFFDEYRFYHRKDGKIVKLKDDILSAVRCAIMMRRHGKAVQLGAFRVRVPTNLVASGLDFDLHAV